LILPLVLLLLASCSESPSPTSAAQLVHYPPATVTDLLFLAAKGDYRAIHKFQISSGDLMGSCPQPKHRVTVDPSLTGQQLAEDLLAYFYAQHLDNSCGSVVFAYHDEKEASDSYTAGRILVKVTDPSSGAINLDPNAINLNRSLTLDTGGAYTHQEYVVPY
jgi:hypothetical protein